MKTIAIAGTFDTKGNEYQYVKNLVTELGFRAFMIHTGVFEPAFAVDVSNQEIAAAAGFQMDELAAKKDRGIAMEVLSKGMEILIPKLYQTGKFDGIISFGGSGGTSLVAPAMRALPIGVPKVMVSTMTVAAGGEYIGTSDIIMIPSIVDVAGLNQISRTIFRNAVLAIAGMVGMKDKLPADQTESKPLVAATMFGVTTPCVNQAKDYLEANGYEVLVFHATGTGGKTMEALIDNGFFKGVLDLTTTEWCDQVVGGVLAAGPNRSEAAVRQGIPQVVSVGAMDMVNFGSFDSVPQQFKDRKLYKHNPSVTLMRTTIAENREIGRHLAEKLKAASGNTVLMLPLKGVSAIDAEGQAFYGAQEDAALFAVLKEELAGSKVEVMELEAHINDSDFALTAAKKLVELMNK
ncbi:UPF0261 family protein [Clostridiales bacterium COT073_COT-073]|nr:UPF0261 family protein [Clostridiales bacterium COT073_COT-073]